MIDLYILNFFNLYHQHMSFHRTSIICWLITCHQDQVFYKYFTNYIFIFGLTGPHCLQNYFTSGTWYHQIQGNSDEVIFSFLWWNDCSVTGWGVNCRFEKCTVKIMVSQLNITRTIIKPAQCLKINFKDNLSMLSLYQCIRL